MTRVLGLVRGDLRNIGRDPILILIATLPFVIGLVMRFGVPFVAGLVAPWVELTAYYGFIQSFLLLFAPCFVGWVIGFLLLDERDEDILTAIAVTPLMRRGFLAYRLAMPTVASFIASLLVVPIAGLAPFNPLLLVPVAMVAALEAPMMAMFLVAFAGNKVEGLALAKGVSVVLFAPLAILFLEPPWQLLFGLLPPFWVSKAYLAAAVGPGELILALLGGLVSHGLVLWFLLRRFAARIN